MKNSRFLFIPLLISVLVLSVMLGTVAVSADPGEQDDGQQHVVQTGENLYRIAKRYNATISAIVDANELENPNVIYVGQVLTIPGGATDGQIPSDEEPESAEPVEDETPAPSEQIHVVQRGENLWRIAEQYDVSVQAIIDLNNIQTPNIIHSGLQLRIPDTTAPAAAPADTAPAATTDDTTADATAADDTDVTDEEEDPTEATPIDDTAASTTDDGAMDGDDVVDEDEADVGGGEPTGDVLDTTDEPATGEVISDPIDTSQLPPSQAPVVGFEHGITVLPDANNRQASVDRIVELGLDWVRLEVDWRFIEPVQGQYNWTDLDADVDALNAAELNILLNVSNAPNWARNSQEENGPPADPQDLANLMSVMAERYQGRVQAYEIWYQPNLRTEWNTNPLNISGAAYVVLLQPTYVAIKNIDPAAIVVTAGLAPTGLSDGVNAIADRVFLRQMYEAGVAEVSDAVGAHPYGFANPPDDNCCNTNPDRDWDDDRTFFFEDTLRDYRDIMRQNGDQGTFVWVTEFGWGSIQQSGNQLEDLNVPTPGAYGFVEFNSLDEQAAYTVRAYQIGEELGFVGPMFLYNLNYCQVFGPNAVSCLWSVLDAAGNPRPVFNAIRDMTKN
jgi:LysM repeat protein